MACSDLLCERFIEFQGKVAIREKIHPMFKPKTLKPLDEEISHIIVENIKTIPELCRHLNCPEIPEKVVVVHRKWLEDCLCMKSLQDVAQYTIDKNASPEDKVHSKKEFSTNNKSLDSKRKRDGDCEVHGQEKRSRQAIGTFTYNCDERDDANEFGILTASNGRASLLYFFPTLQRSTFSNIIAFDLDGTLITTKSGAKFSKSSDDWKFFHQNVPNMIREKYHEGAHIAIISNQNGISKGHTTIGELKTKLRAIIAELGII